MTKDDIYDHLAQVYLGKRKNNEDSKKQKKQFSVWLFINIVITVIIFASAFYGLTAFLTHRSTSFENKIIYSLHNGPVRIEYDFFKSVTPVTSFHLEVPDIDATKYEAINLSIRAREEGSPGIIKVVLTNHKNETAYYYIQGVQLKWQDITIPLKEFKQITDWTNLKDLSFVLESWNVEKRKGMVLIDNICFSNDSAG